MRFWVSVVSSGTARESENGGFVGVEQGPRSWLALSHASALTGEQTIGGAGREFRRIAYRGGRDGRGREILGLAEGGG